MPVAISAALDSRTVELGKQVAITGSIKPDLAGLVLVLQSRVDGAWVITKTTKVASNGTFRFSAHPTTSGATVWKVATPKTSTRAVGASNVLHLRVSKWTWLGDLRTIDSHRYWFNTDPIEADGVDYRHPVNLFNACNFGGQWWFEWNLGRKYQQFQTTLAFDDEARDGASATYEISVDGRVLTTGSLTFGMSTRVDESVRKGLRLRIQINNATPGVENCPGVTEGWFVLGDARLLS